MFRYFLSLSMLLSLAQVTIPARAETWSVVCEGSNPPYNFVKDGAMVGLDTEIVAAVFKKIGVAEDPQTLPWARAVAAFDEGTIDVLYQMVATPERQEKYLLVGPIRVGRTVFIVPADSTITFNTLDDLKPYQVTVVNGYMYTQEFTNAPLDKNPVKDAATLIRLVAAGRAPVAIGDATSLLFIAKQEGLADKIKILPKALKEVPRYVAFSKSNADKARRFGEGLDAIRADGTLDKIIKSWE